jgi:hypothetical protein
MAIYHLNARTGTRGNGQSARAKNEYIEREGRYAGRDGQKKANVQVVLYGNMPEWAMNHHDYWKAADQYERSNGRLYKEIEFALPVELNPEEMKKAAQDFAEYLTGKERLPYTFAIHINDPGNPHCHLMISERANDGIERSPEVWFSRANSKAPEKGGAKKTTSLMPKEWLLDTRSAWERIANQTLELAGNTERIDYRTLKAQGVDREPTTHRGVNREAKRNYEEVLRLEKELCEAKMELAKLERSEEQEAEGEARATELALISPETTASSTKTIPERDRRILQIAERVGKEQEDLRAKYEAACANFRELEEMEPRGLGEFFGESKKRKDWSEKLKSAKSDVRRLWEELGGDMDAPNKGASEVQWRLAPEYARAEAERIVADEERRKRLEEDRAQKIKEERAKLEEAREEARSKDMALVEVGREVSCHVEGVKGQLTGTILRIDDDSGKIEIRCGDKKLMFFREKIYFTEAEPQRRGGRVNAERDKRLCDYEQDLGR